MNCMAWIKSPILIVVLTQILFTSGDLLARANMRRAGFSAANFLNWWFLVYFTFRQVAMLGQLYVFSSVQLGKTMALFGATSIVLSQALGFFLLKEVLSPGAYIGVALAVMAFIVLASS